jgi:hypothetical protein
MVGDAGWSQVAAAGMQSIGLHAGAVYVHLSSCSNKPAQAPIEPARNMNGDLYCWPPLQHVVGARRSSSAALCSILKFPSVVIPLLQRL